MCPTDEKGHTEYSLKKMPNLKKEIAAFKRDIKFANTFCVDLEDEMFSKAVKVLKTVCENLALKTNSHAFEEFPR